MDNEFQGLWEALQAKRKALRLKGKGRCPNASVSLSKAEKYILWNGGHLGDHNPEILVCTSWYTSMMHLVGVVVMNMNRGKFVWEISAQNRHSRWTGVLGILRGVRNKDKNLA